MVYIWSTPFIIWSTPFIYEHQILYPPIGGSVVYICSTPFIYDYMERFSYILHLYEHQKLYGEFFLLLTQMAPHRAVAELRLSDVLLLNCRGKLLQLARKKVADDGYVFKKGHSLSKLYGIPQNECAPKRPKYSQGMREGRIEAISGELCNIARTI